MDPTAVDALALMGPGSEVPVDGKKIRQKVFCPANIKRRFMNAVKNAIHDDSRSDISIALKLPYFIILISACEVLMYVFASKNARDVFIYNPKKKCDLWRFLTYILLHNDSIHLGLNVVIQFLLAAPLEIEQGLHRTAAIYFGGGIAGSLGASVFDNESMLVGASGGIYALLISQISHVILNYKTLKYVMYRIVAVLVLALADIAYLCYHIRVFNNESPRIGLAAHFAGALSGLLLGTSFFKGTMRWKNHIHIVSAIIIFILIIFAIFYNLKRTTDCK